MAFSGLKLVAAFLIVSVTAPMALSQQRADQDAEALSNRYLQILIRRPRQGTALEQLHSLHVQAGTLEQLVDRLETEIDAGGEQAARKRAIIGLLYVQHGDEEEAIRHLQNAESQLAKDPMVSFYLAKAQAAIGHNDEAVQALRRAIERKPVRNDALEIFKTLARLHQRLGNSKEALAAYRQLQDIYPDDQRVCEEIATALAEDGQLEPALEQYQQLIEQTGQGAESRIVGYRIEAAELKRLLGKDAEAIKDFEKILTKLRPSSWLYADVRRRIESGFVRTGDYDAMAEYYGQQHEANPDDLELNIRFGRALALAGRLSDSIEMMRAALAKAPDDENLRLELIKVLRRSGDNAAAAGEYESLVKIAPENPDYFVAWGNAILEDTSVDLEQRTEKAVDVWKRLASLRANDPVIIASVADLMRRIARTDDAIRFYRQAIELSPQRPQFREYLGEYLHRLGRKKEAVKVWRAMAEGSRKSPANLIRLSEVCGAFGYHQEAIDAFTEAAKSDLNFGQRLRFATLLVYEEQFSEALTQLSKADAIAESPDQRDQALQLRIGIYSQAGTLAAQITELQTRMRTVNKPDDFRVLALMLQADSRAGEAVQTIDEAVSRAPHDIAILSTAADLYELSSRLEDAVSLYQRLLTLDRRYSSTYVRRIATMQLQLGQVADALGTAKRLVIMQPTNPESYRFLAELCFKAGTAEEGIAALRRATRLAPRDISLRDALAKALTKNLRISEAIEVHWQSLELAADLEQQRSVISALVPLYNRLGELPKLINRLRRPGRSASDVRSSLLLMSHVYRSQKNYSAARQVLQPLVSDHPRDTVLLAEMIQLSQQLKDIDSALEHQRQLTAVADTPRNRHTLFTMMLEAGKLDEAEASFRTLQGADDTPAMVKLIDRLIQKQRDSGAIRLCRVLLKDHPDLWEVKARLAALLVRSNDVDEALKIAKEVRALKLSPDETPVTRQALAQKQAAQTSPVLQSSRSSQTPISGFNRRNDQVFVITLARFFGDGRFDALRSASRSVLPSMDISAYWQARIVAMAVELQAALKQQRVDDFIAQQIRDLKIETCEDVNELWEARDLFLLATSLYRSTVVAWPSMNDDFYNDVIWRLAELDADGIEEIVYQQLSVRASLRRRVRPTLPSAARVNITVRSLNPLKESQIKTMLRIFQHQQKNPAAVSNAIDASWVYEELVASGEADQASQLKDAYAIRTGSLMQTSQALKFYNQTRGTSGARQMLAHAHASFGDWSSRASRSEIQFLMSEIRKAGITGDPKDEHLIVDLMIAANVVETQRGIAAATTPRLLGYLNQPTSTRGIRYRTIRQPYPIPYATEMLPNSLAQDLIRRFTSLGSTQRRDLIDHLTKDMSLLSKNAKLSAQEQKLRNVVAAYVSWWALDLAEAHKIMLETSRKHPNDVDLKVELARMALELDRPREALGQIDNIETAHPSTRTAAEWIAVAAAVREGDKERCKLAGERLYPIQLTSAQELTVIDHMMNLRLQDLPNQYLVRARARKDITPEQLIEIAQRHSALRNYHASAEAALHVLQQIDPTSGGRSTSSNRLRVLAIELLRRNGQINEIVLDIEKRAGESGSPEKLYRELLDIYLTLDRSEDAERLLDKIGKPNWKDPALLLSTARQLVARKMYTRAIDWFLASFDRDPTLIRTQLRNLQNCLTHSRQLGHIYREAATWNINQIERSSLLAVANLYQEWGTRPPPEAIAFVDRILKTAEPHSFQELVDSIATHEDFRSSKGMAEAAARMIANKVIYSPETQIWNRFDIDESGTCNGPLTSWISSLDAHPEIRQQVIDELQSRQSDPQMRSIALALSVAIQASSRNAAETFQQVNTLFQTGWEQIPVSLWWQLGQSLQSNPELRRLAVHVFQRIQADQRLSRITSKSGAAHGYLYGIGAKLADAYILADQIDDARRHLINCFEDLEAFPGKLRRSVQLGDHLGLVTCHEIAKTLTSIDSPLEAIWVYTGAISQSDGIAFSRTRSNRKDYRRIFQAELQRSRESLTDRHYRDFLLRAAEHGGTDEHETKLLAIPPTKDTKAKSTSMAAIAVEQLCRDESGRDFLRDLHAELCEIRNARDAADQDWGLLGLSTIVAVNIEADDGIQPIRQLRKLFADYQKQQDILNKLAVYSPALIAMGSDDKQISEQAFYLTASILPSVKQAKQEAMHRLLSKAQLSAIGSTFSVEEKASAIAEMLRGAAPNPQPTNPVSSESAAICLELAELALDVRAFDLAADALRRGFAGGIPYQRLASVRTRTMGAYRGPSVVEVQKPIGLSQTQALAPRLAKAAGRLFQQAPKPEPVFETLSQVVFPNDPVDVCPYVVPVVGGDSDSLGVTATNSVALSLAQAAVSCGKFDDLEKLIESRRPTQSRNRLEVNLTATLLAIEMNDAGGVIEGLTDLRRIMLTPSEDGPDRPTNLSVTDVVKITNALLHLISRAKPLIGRHEVIDSIEAELVRRAASSRSLATENKLWRELTLQLCSSPRATDPVRRTVLANYFKSVQRIELNPVRSSALKRADQERKRFFFESLSKGHLDTAAVVLREIAAHVRSLGLQSDQSQDLIPIAVAVRQQDPADQFKILSYALLGEPDETFRDWASYLLFAQPPPDFELLTPQLAQLENLPIAHQDFPVTSLSLLLAAAAGEANKTDELKSRLAALDQDNDARVQAFSGIVHLISGDHQAAIERLEQVAARFKSTDDREKLFAGQIPFLTSTLALRCLPFNRELAAQVLNDSRNHARYVQLTYLRTFYNRAVLKLGGTEEQPDEKQALMDHFVAVQVPDPGRPETSVTAPLFRVQGQRIRYAGGADQNLLMLRYPLQGKFSLGYRCVDSGRSHTGIALGGVVYGRDSETRLAAFGIGGRGVSRFPCDPVGDENHDQLLMRVNDDQTDVLLNGEKILSDSNSMASPFVSIHLPGARLCELSDLVLDGNVRIPRQVSLIDDRLRGWTTPVIAGSLPNINLSIAPGEDKAAAKRIRHSTPAQEATRRAWYSDAGLLKSGRPQPGAPHGMAHLQYLRPICDGESIEYEFRYVPGVLEVHPAMGRTVMLLREGGVTLRWLAVAGSQEVNAGLLDDQGQPSFDPLHEVRPRNRLDGWSEYKLKPNEWNKVKLTAEKNFVTLQVNGAPICRVETGPRQKLGVFHEMKRACEIRNIMLSGDWPEALPPVVRALP